MYLKTVGYPNGFFAFKLFLQKKGNLIRYIIQEDPEKKVPSDLFADRAISDYKKAQLGIYRTKKSDVPENWGKKQKLILTNI